MTRRPYLALPSVAVLALGACTASSSAPAPATSPVGAVAAARAGAPDLNGAAATITPQDMYSRIEFLAADEMRGRNTPSPELNIAASYLVSQYKLWGFQPAGERGSFYQWYPFPTRRLSVSGTRLQLAGTRGTRSLQVGRDFYTAGGTPSGLSSAGMVYVGNAPAAVMTEGTLRGRVAVAALPGRNAVAWRTERNRQRNAARRAGALAIVHVLDESWTADSIAAYSRSAQREARVLGTDPQYPQVFLSQAAARQLFADAGLSLDEQMGRAKGAGFTTPVPLAGVTATGAIPSERVDEGLAPNVVAMIPGSDPALRNEYVVISAHMDHIGVTAPVNGDSINNGADDDASGTAGLLEVAEAMASLPAAQRPRRTVVFLHVSGEEKGLLGSEWYSDHPTLPLPQIVANINVDMIARNAADSVIVIGKNYSTLGQTTNRLQQQHPELRLTLADDIWPEERFFFRSDHYNFARKEVPSIFFFSGVHADYHRPSDEVEKIDSDKAARIARMVFYLAYDVANTTERPRWDPRGLEEVRGMTR